MRRRAAGILGSVAGLALLVSAKLGTRPPADLSTVTTSPRGDQTSSVPWSGDGPAGSPAPATAPPSGAPDETPVTTPKSGVSPTDTTSPTTPAPTSGSSLRAGTFAGVAVTHKYGTLQVTITVADGTMTNVTAAYSTSFPVSEEINAEALPKLREEALTAQSADIATVSGATYTSGAYRSSLQSALDNAEG